MAGNKRIALFLDGTWNNVRDNTNVWRLKSLCSKLPSSSSITARASEPSLASVSEEECSASASTRR